MNLSQWSWLRCHIRVNEKFYLYEDVLQMSCCETAPTSAMGTTGSIPVGIPNIKPEEKHLPQTVNTTQFTLDSGQETK